MPQFAFDGIFAPIPLPSVAPQRQSNAGKDDALFHEHLAKASRPPVASPADRDRSTSKPPEYTTQPVRTDERRTEDNQADANKDHTTHATDRPKPTHRDKPQQAQARKAEQADTEDTTDTARLDESADGNEALAATVVAQQADVVTEDASKQLEEAVSSEVADRVVATHRNAKVKVEVDNSSKSPTTPEVQSPASEQDRLVETTKEATESKESIAKSATVPKPVDASANEAAAVAESVDVAPVSEESESTEANLDAPAKAELPEDATTDDAVARTSHEVEIETQNAVDRIAEQSQAAESTTDRRKSTSTSSRRRDDSRKETPTSTARADKSAAQNATATAPSTVELAADETSSDIPELSTDTTPAERGAAAVSTPTIAPGTTEAGATSNTTSPTPGNISSDAVVERNAQPAPNSTRDTEKPNVRSHLLSEVERFRIVQRVARAISTSTTSADGGQMRLRLSPPELGSLKLDIVVRQGTVTARVEAETAAAREVLLDNLPALRDRLAEQNIRLERFEVDLMRQSLDQSPQHAGGQNGERDAHEHGSSQASARSKALESVEHMVTSAPLIQDGHVNIVV